MYHNALKNREKIFSVAPMMEWTDRHCRVFHRAFSRRALLYTEMVTADALLHGDRQRLIGYSAIEHPVALQLGGSDPFALAEAAKIGADWGYDEINLNCGCPSDRVRSGCFGASLMAQPDQVARCVEAMRAAVKVPISVKCRIGIDNQDRQALDIFINALSLAGVDAVIVHARKAWLKGLSPKENRTKPPLDYKRVYQLKQAFPHLWIGLNGGVETLDEVKHHLVHVDGVMMGRAAYHRPTLLSAVDHCIYGEQTPSPTSQAAVRAMLPYIEDECAKGVRLHHITRHMLGLFHGCRGARTWRRMLTMPHNQSMAPTAIVVQALQHITGEPLPETG